MIDNRTFADLPDALVRDLLQVAESVGITVSQSINGLMAGREDLRRRAQERRVILKRADLDVVREPSVAGIDGSYQVHRLTATDLCAAAAVAIEGTIREDRRKWREPYHRLWLDCLPHAPDTANGLRGVMVSMELELAEMAPHDVILLDGAFSPLVIYLNQSKTAEAPPALRQVVNGLWEPTVKRLLSIIGGDSVVAVPKYATRNELARKLGVDVAVDGKTLATSILEPGEYTAPDDVYGDDRAYHLPDLGEDDAQALRDRMANIKVVYFRPYGWLPAVRLELPAPQTRNLHRLALVLEGIARQLMTPAVFEPYPLFLADRMVKSLGAGVAAVETAIRQHVVDNSSDVEGTLVYMRQHRTEGGR